MVFNVNVLQRAQQAYQAKKTTYDTEIKAYYAGFVAGFNDCANMASATTTGRVTVTPDHGCASGRKHVVAHNYDRIFSHKNQYD